MGTICGVLTAVCVLLVIIISWLSSDIKDYRNRAESESERASTALGARRSRTEIMQERAFYRGQSPDWRGIHAVRARHRSEYQIASHVWHGTAYSGAWVKLWVGEQTISHHRLVLHADRTDQEIVDRLAEALELACQELLAMSRLIDSRECGGK